MWVSGWVGFESVCEKEGNREREGQRQGGGERESGREGGREGQQAHLQRPPDHRTAGTRVTICHTCHASRCPPPPSLFRYALLPLCRFRCTR